MLLSIDEIKVNPRRYELDQAHVQSLADNMAESGLMCSITVSVNHILIAGLHRLEAAKRLGWPEIECTVLDLTDMRAELAEIDENMIRRNLDVVERGEMLLRRKEIYEALHPETKHGGDRRSEKIKSQKLRLENAKSFVEDTAEKLGVSPRTVELQIQTAKNLTPEVKELLKKSGERITQDSAVRLAKLCPEQQEKAALSLVSGEVKSVDEYCCQKMKEQFQEEQQAEFEEPFRIRRPRYSGFAEAYADIKNPDKDFTCTPESFLDEVMCFAQKFQRDISWFSDPYYEDVQQSLTKPHLDFLHEQMDSICSNARKFYKSVERKSKK